jgi:hypothetical protein
MPLIESFSCSDPGGVNKTIITRAGTSPSTWAIANLAAQDEATMHAIKSAVSDALAQTLSGGRYNKVIDTFAGPDVTFDPKVVGDPADDTIVIAALPAFSRDKALDFIAAVDAYIPAPPPVP